MANRQRGYGLTAAVNAKIQGKYDLEMEAEAREWIEALIGEPLAHESSSDVLTAMTNFHLSLKDGVVLCNLINVLMPGAVKKVNKGNLAFKQMENIGLFLAAAEKYGVSKTDLFQTVDLFEKTNMASVLTTLHSLGRRAQTNGFDGPVIGPKESTQNKRQFSEEQLQEGKKVIGLQMGTNKGASQAGMNFGQARHINDINVGEMSKDGQNVISLQMGSNKGANASGVNMGKSRQIMD